MATSPVFVNAPRGEQEQFVAAFATRPRRIWTPGASGSRIHAINIASSSATAKSLQLFIGKVVTAESAMGNGSLVDGGGGVDQINRTTGNFQEEGWHVGQRVMIDGATTLANNLDALISVVSGSNLDLPTGTIGTAEALPENSALYRLNKLGFLAVPAGSGQPPSGAAVSGLSTAQLPMLDDSPDRYITLGADDVLFAALTEALIVDETVGVSVFGADY